MNDELHITGSTEYAVDLETSPQAIIKIARDDAARLPLMRDQRDAWTEMAELSEHVKDFLDGRIAERLKDNISVAVYSVNEHAADTRDNADLFREAANLNTATFDQIIPQVELFHAKAEQLGGEIGAVDDEIAALPQNLADSDKKPVMDVKLGLQDELRTALHESSSAYQSAHNGFAYSPPSYEGAPEWTGPNPEVYPGRHGGGGDNGGRSAPIAAGGSAPSWSGEYPSNPQAPGGAVPDSVTGPQLQASGPAPVAPQPPVSAVPPSSGGTAPPIPPGPSFGGPSTKPVVAPPSGRTAGPPAAKPTPGMGTRHGGGGPLSRSAFGPTGTGRVPAGQGQFGPAGSGRVPGGGGPFGRGGTAPLGSGPTGTGRTSNNAGPIGRAGAAGGDRATNPATRPGPTGSKASRALLPSQRSGTAASTGVNPTGGPGRPGVAPGRTASATGLFGGRTRTTVPSVIGGRGSGGAAPAAGSGPSATAPAGVRNAGKVIGERPNKGGVAAQAKPAPKTKGGILTRNGVASASRVGKWGNTAKTRRSGAVLAGKVIGKRGNPSDTADAAAEEAKQRRVKKERQDAVANWRANRKALPEHELAHGLDGTVVPDVIEAQRRGSDRVSRKDIGRVFGSHGWEN